MKKILLTIGLLLTFIFANGQLAGIIASQDVVSGYVARSSHYQDVYDEMTTKPTDVIAGYQDDMVFSLDSLTVWDDTYYLNIYATSTSTTEALINWIDVTANADDTSATSWTALEGYTGNGTDDYLSTNFNLSTASVPQDDVAGFVYVMNNTQNGAGAYGYQGTNDFFFTPRNASDQQASRINNNADQITASVTDGRGFWISSRIVSSDVVTYKNGSQVDTEADASTGVANGELHVLSRNGDEGYSDVQIAIFGIMRGIDNETEASKISTIYNRYMTRIGKNVY